MDRALNLDLLVTRACPLACGYCRMDHRPGPVPERMWRRAVDLLLEEEPPVELQLMGGEPLLHYGVVRRAASYARRRSPGASVVLTTNGLLLTPERSRELGELGCAVMLSLDGVDEVQARQRPAPSGGARYGAALSRNLDGLLRSGTPFFVNLVATPESADRLAEGVAFLLGRGVRAVQVAAALGVFWDDAALGTLEAQLAEAARRADAAGAELFNRRNGAEPVLLSPQHVVDTDGSLYVGTSTVLERLWPALHAAFRRGNVLRLRRLPGRRAGAAEQLRRLKGARVGAAQRRVLLNNLAAGYRLRRFWARA